MAEKKTLRVIDQDQLTLFTLEEGKSEGKEVLLERSYRVVGDEVLNQKLDPECWAKALAAGGKTKDAALSMYAQIRAEELVEKTNHKESKASALEKRKLASAVPDSHYQTRIIWRKNFSLMWDFLFWQILLSVSGVGLFLVLLAMGTDSKWWPGLLPLVIVSAFLQLSPVIFYGLGKLLIGRVSYTQALGVTAIMLISLGSYMGVQTMTDKRSPRWVQLALNQAIEIEEVKESPVFSEEEF